LREFKGSSSDSLILKNETGKRTREHSEAQLLKPYDESDDSIPEMNIVKRLSLNREFCLKKGLLFALVLSSKALQKKVSSNIEERVNAR
jgi:hypothetical protein